MHHTPRHHEYTNMDLFTESPISIYTSISIYKSKLSLCHLIPVTHRTYRLGNNDQYVVVDHNFSGYSRIYDINAIHG